MATALLRKVHLGNHYLGLALVKWRFLRLIEYFEYKDVTSTTNAEYIACAEAMNLRETTFGLACLDCAAGDELRGVERAGIGTIQTSAAIRS
jgi:hypothetical protein